MVDGNGASTGSKTGTGSSTVSSTNDKTVVDLRGPAHASTISSEGTRAVADVEEDIVVCDPRERYELRATLGEGGMGEVRLCGDRVIGRDVAMKVMLPAISDQHELHARFVREARVQGQLEHPAIVPVYDFGKDNDGRAFFTMKRVRGATLERVLELLHEGDPATVREHTRHKLLAMFVRVCLAVDFAHERGVVHRDLKPGNVMLGDYGEVYVLDWGVAKVRSAARSSADLTSSPQVTGGPAAAAAATVTGAILGTPAYMAPEQIRGDDVDARSDVYALGAILFELLTLEPLHGHGNVAAMMKRALQGADARPSTRAPARDVPPELEAVCVGATALDRRQRYASARMVADAVEAYLSGDRDVELRRELGRVHVERARDAVSRAQVPGAENAERAEALHELGRALALVPDDVDARTLLMQILVEPPASPPEEVTAALEHAARTVRQRMLRQATLLLAVPFVFVLPFAFLFGVRDLGLALLVPAMCALAALTAWAGRVSKVDVDVVMLLRTAFIALAALASGFLYGPFVLTPTIAAIGTTAMVLTRPRRLRLLSVTTMVIVGVLLPTLAVWLGHFPVPHSFEGTELRIMATTIMFPRATPLFMALVNATLVIAAAMHAGVHSDARTTAEMRNQLQAWHLRQLVPADAARSLAAPERTARR